MEGGSIGSSVELPANERTRSPVEGADWVPNPLSRSPSQASAIRSGLRRPSLGAASPANVVADGGLYSPPRSSASSPQVRRFQTPEGCDWRPPPELLRLVSEEDAVCTPPRRHPPMAAPTHPMVSQASPPVSPPRTSSVSVAVQTPTEISDWGLPMPEGSDWKPFQVVQTTGTQAVEETDADSTVSAGVLLGDATEVHATSPCVDAGLDGCEVIPKAPEKAPEQAAEMPSEHEHMVATSQTEPECTPEQGIPSFVPAEDHGPAPIASPDLCSPARRVSARDDRQESLGMDEKVEEASQLPRTPVRMLTPAASYSEETPKLDLQVTSTTDEGSREDSQLGFSPPSSRINSASLPSSTSTSSGHGPTRKQAGKKAGKTESVAKQPPHFMFHPSHRGSALGPPRGSHKNSLSYQASGRPGVSARSPPPPALPFSQSLRAPTYFSPCGPHRSPHASSRGQFARTGRSPEPAVLLSRVRSPPRALVATPAAPPFCATSPRTASLNTSAACRSPSMDGRAVSRSSSINPNSPGQCHRRMLYPLSGSTAVVRQPSFAGHAIFSGAPQQDSLGRTQRKFNSPRSLSAAPPIGSFVAHSSTGSYVAPPLVGSYVAPPQCGSYVAPPQIGSFVAPPPPPLWNRYTPPDSNVSASAGSLKRSYVAPPFSLSSHSPTRMMHCLSSRGGAASRAPSPPVLPMSSRRKE